MTRLFGIALAMIFFFPAFSQEPSRPKQPDFPGDLLMDWGFNTWTSSPTTLPLKLWGSNSFSIYYTQRYKIINRIDFNAGIGFTFDKYAFDPAHTKYTWLSASNGTVSLDTLKGVSYTKNKLVMNYLEVPLEIRIHPLGTVKGEGWFIGLGVVGGARFDAHTKVKYTINKDDYKEKVYGTFDINRFRYGVQARFGFKTIHVYYKMYLNDVFKSAPDASGKIPMASSFGISFSGF